MSIPRNLSKLADGADSSGILTVAGGGTGQTSYTNGQLLIGNTTGNTLTKATLTAGTGISVTNGNGSITIASTGSVSAATPTALGTVYGKTTDYAVTSTFETSLGYQAGAANTSTSITAVGNRALQQNTSGFANTAVGKDAANGNTTGSYLTAVGYQALGGGSTGNYNTAVGFNSLANTAGNYTVAIGYQAMMSSASNGNNVAIGSNAAKTLTGSGYNTVVGSEAMPVATSGSGTTAVGYGALSQLSTGSQNTVIGVSAGNTVTTGANNVFVGAYANGPIASQYVTMVGASAGQGSDSGNYSTYIGYGAYPSASGTATNEIALGALCRGKGSNTIAIGKSANYVYLDFTTDNTWTRLSDKRLKTNIKPENTGLDFINRLSPVTFNWKPSYDIPKELTSHYSETNEKNTDAVVAGFIAQDVKKALDESNATNNLGWRCDEEGVQSLAEGVFILPLVNAVKELSAKLDALEAKHNAYVASHP